MTPDKRHAQITAATTAGLELLTGVPSDCFTFARSRRLEKTRVTTVFVDALSNEGADVVTSDSGTAYAQIRLSLGDHYARQCAADKIREFFDEVGLADVPVHAGSYVARSADLSA